MLLIRIKVSLENTTRTGFPSFSIFSNQKVRLISILSGLRFASSEYLMDTEEQLVLTI